MRKKYGFADRKLPRDQIQGVPKIQLGVLDQPRALVKGKVSDGRGFQVAV
ncbi:MAG: hypothetical protein J7619_30410 [Dyadobacter sp.]|nr:hypothetical protein [Dyadobacter sp.]MBO9617039.1 hypothetical protein [Dyadobacter sp.]